MSTLQDFLNRNLVDNLTKEVAISDRLRDENGALLKAKIQTMTVKELNALRKDNTKINKKGKPEVDTEKLNTAIVIENTIDPNFKDAESMKLTGCIKPEQYLDKVLLSGEVATLSDEILKFSGFNTSMNELVDEVKN